MESTSPNSTVTREPYEPPAVAYEAPLEVQAGSPLSLPLDPLDLQDGGQ